MKKNIFTKIFNIIFATADQRVSYHVRALVWLKARNRSTLGSIVSKRLQRKYGVFLPYEAQFNATLTLRHPIGIVIGEGVVLGNNVKIYQNVTLGRADTKVEAYPTIGNNTIIYSGAAIVGGVKVGKNCVVGANAVVLQDIPDNSVAVGVPAKAIAKK